MQYITFFLQCILYLSLLSTMIYLFFVACFSPSLPEDWRWTKVIWKTRKNWVRSNDNYFYIKYKNKDYVIAFHESWLFNIYEGKTKEEIQHKYALGGQSNKADYLRLYQLRLGKKIERYYLEFIKKYEWNYE